MTPRSVPLDIQGQSIEGAWWGPGPDEAPTIVMLHEGLGCVALWRGFPAALAAATGWGVFAYSRFGYGQSAPVALPRPLTYMHDEARDILPLVLDAAGPREMVLLGHSDGGSIALLYAGTKRDARLKGLITMAAHVFVEDLSIASIDAAKTAYLTTDLPQRMARYHADPENAFWGWNGAWLDPGFRAWRIDEALPGIHVPVLAIQGTEDEYGTEAQIQAIQKGIPAPVEVLMVQGAKHAPHLYAPDLTAQVIRNFLIHIKTPAG